MPKAIISNRIYLDKPPDCVLNFIKQKLTYSFVSKFSGKGNMKKIEKILTYKLLPNGIVSLPQQRIDLIPDNYEIVDRRVTVPVEFPDPKFDLFEEQQKVYDNIHDTAIINAMVGWGKSYTGLWVANKFRQKTLVITHTVSLKDQWFENVEELFGIKAGLIVRGTIDYEKHPIVVSNIQTLVKHVDRISKVFGTVILDECHHVPASTFLNVIDKINSRYRLALSGTLIRKDGKHVIIPDYFGTNVQKPPQSNTLTPYVKLVRTNIGLVADLPWAEKISRLVRDEDYQNFIAALAKGQMYRGHSVLVISDRVEFLQAMEQKIGDKCVLVTGKIGDRKQAKEDIMSGKKSCIAGSRQIFSEGLSINKLSCVILALPINNDSLLEQIVGRIQRMHPDKKDPIVCDIQFCSPAERVQNMNRQKFYESKGWHIEVV